MALRGKRKERVSISILGLNRSEPNHSVKDGYCSKLHNMRYSGGAWRNVSDYKINIPITQSNGYTIIYRHPALPAGDYIATFKGTTICRVRILNGEVIFVENIVSSIAIKVNHYGNILWVLTSEGRQAYIYNNDKYCLFDTKKITPLDNINISIDRQRAFPDADEVEELDPVIAKVDTANNGTEIITRESRYNAVCGRLLTKNYIPGVIYVMVAYRLWDGSVVKPSRLYKIGDNPNCNNELLWRGKYDDTYYYSAKVYGVKASLSINVPSTVRDMDLVKSVVVYSTRNSPTLDVEHIYEVCKDDPGNPYRDNIVVLPLSKIKNNANSDIINTPLYEIAEIDFRTTYTLELDYYTHYSNIETKPVYEANFSVHDIISCDSMEYNNRLHIYDSTKKLFTPDYNNLMYTSGTYPHTYDPTKDHYIYKRLEGYRMYLVFWLSIEGEERPVAMPPQATYCYHKYNSNSRVDNYTYIILPDTIVSYPDSRVKRLSIYFRDNSTGKFALIKSVELKGSTSNNYAYNLDCFEVISFSENYNLVLNFDNIIRCSNKLEVSDSGNPFYFAPRHVYTIASDCKILGINTASDQLTEGRFGDYPLVVFTDRGVFALQNGSGEVLYGSVTAINKDVITSAGSVGTGGILFYISERGIVGLQGRDSRVISLLLHDALGEFTRYLIGARLSYYTFYGELIVYNSGDSFAYVYNIVNDVWSTRDYGGINIGDMSVLHRLGFGSFIDDEDSSKPLIGSLETCPLKLGSYEYKRVTVFNTRYGGDDPSVLSSTLLGSNDIVRDFSSAEGGYKVLRSEGLAGHLVRTPFSSRYFRIITNSVFGKFFSITGYVIEYFDRFVRHVR